MLAWPADWLWQIDDNMYICRHAYGRVVSIRKWCARINCLVQPSPLSSNEMCNRPQLSSNPKSSSFCPTKRFNTSCRIQLRAAITVFSLFLWCCSVFGNAVSNKYTIQMLCCVPYDYNKRVYVCTAIRVCYGFVARFSDWVRIVQLREAHN